MKTYINNKFLQVNFKEINNELISSATERKEIISKYLGNIETTPFEVINHYDKSKTLVSTLEGIGFINYDLQRVDILRLGGFIDLNPDEYLVATIKYQYACKPNKECYLDDRTKAVLYKSSAHNKSNDFVNEINAYYSKDVLVSFKVQLKCSKSTEGQIFNTINLITDENPTTVIKLVDDRLEYKNISESLEELCKPFNNILINSILEQELNFGYFGKVTGSDNINKFLSTIHIDVLKHAGYSRNLQQLLNSNNSFDVASIKSVREKRRTKKPVESMQWIQDTESEAFKDVARIMNEIGRKA